MKGIILAGGNGTRLAPMTRAVNKHLLCVYNKPMIYYPLTTLMLAEIRDILIITRAQDLCQFKALLGDGSEYGARIQYAVQDKPSGIAESILIAADFIGKDEFTLILGDNILFGSQMGGLLFKAIMGNSGATIFGYHVSNPTEYGVVEFDSEKKVISLEEKPQNPKSNFAVTGLYVYDHEAVEMARTLKPSARGELEITDLNRLYMEQDKLYLVILGRGYCWLDMGTADNLLEASDYVRTIEKRQGLSVCDPIEVGIRNGWI